MSLLAFTITIARELLPFLKEALLEGQSFRVWLRSNWLTFIFLLSSLALTMMVAHLSDLVRAQKAREIELRGDIVALAPAAQALIQKNLTQQLRIEELEGRVTELEKSNDTNLELITQHLEWMEHCGINVQTGQCPPVRPTQRPRRPRQETPATPSVPEDTEQRRGFMRRLRDLLTRNPETE